MATLKGWLRAHGMRRTALREILVRGVMKKWMLVPYWSDAERRAIVNSGDPIRYGTLRLALSEVSKQNIPGALAECGVYRGSLSRFLHEDLRERQLYLFDTFEGFDPRDSHAKGDTRFADTSVDGVLKTIGHAEKIVIRKGYFPETASGLEGERFAFVMIDFDKYEPTKAALEFFYPRVTRGGFIFVHDYNNPESEWACSRALNEFLSSKPEHPVAIPDAWGTVVFRKS
jgi:O-methyltransferase